MFSKKLWSSIGDVEASMPPSPKNKLAGHTCPPSLSSSAIVGVGIIDGIDVIVIVDVVGGGQNGTKSRQGDGISLEPASSSVGAASSED